MFSVFHVIKALQLFLTFREFRFIAFQGFSYLLCGFGSQAYITFGNRFSCNRQYLPASELIRCEVIALNITWLLTIDVNIDVFLCGFLIKADLCVENTAV